MLLHRAAHLLRRASHSSVQFGVPRQHMATHARCQCTDVLLYTEWATKDEYKQLLQKRGLNVLYPSEVEDWDAIGFAVAWKPPAGLLAQCRNLQAVMSLGAGVDHILQPGQVPDSVPILRIVDPRMAERMATWVTWGVISWQRKFEDYGEAQRARRWDLSIEGRRNLDNCDVRVGVMGFGVMGRATAEALHGLGYQVSAWCRMPRQHEAVRCFHGDQGLREFVSGVDVLACLLPLTPNTEGIVNSELLSWMPRGGAVINGARGKHLVESDLLAALDDGQVSFALLDVFVKEPLPPESPLWSHPSIRLTPHVASMTTLESAADQIAANYHSVMGGKGPLPQNVVDRTAGY